MHSTIQTSKAIQLGHCGHFSRTNGTEQTDPPTTAADDGNIINMKLFDSCRRML